MVLKKNWAQCFEKRPGKSRVLVSDGQRIKFKDVVSTTGVGIVSAVWPVFRLRVKEEKALWFDGLNLCRKKSNSPEPTTPNSPAFLYERKQLTGIVTADLTVKKFRFNSFRPRLGQKFGQSPGTFCTVRPVQGWRSAWRQFPAVAAVLWRDSTDQAQRVAAVWWPARSWPRWLRRCDRPHAVGGNTRTPQNAAAPPSTPSPCRFPRIRSSSSYPRGTTWSWWWKISSNRRVERHPRSGRHSIKDEQIASNHRPLRAVLRRPICRSCRRRERFSVGLICLCDNFWKLEI